MLRRLLLILTILVSCVGCDQASKLVAKTYLPQTQRVTLLGDGIRLEIARNYGAFLSMGESIPQPWRAVLLSVGVTVLLVALLAYVLDFLNVGVGPVRTGIFNVADVCILVGVILLLFGDSLQKVFPTRSR